MSNPLYLYRTLEIDDDGDPMDHGTLRAKTPERIREILTARLDELGYEGSLEIRIYPLQDLEEGILESTDEFFDLTVQGCTFEEDEE